MESVGAQLVRLVSVALCGSASLFGCAAGAPELVRDYAAQRWRCTPSAVHVTQQAPDEYEATGCAMRAVYECESRRHHRAEGARYTRCQRVSEHRLAATP